MVCRIQVSFILYETGDTIEFFTANSNKGKMKTSKSLMVWEHKIVYQKQTT